MRLRHALPVPQCAGVDHMDFTADGRRALVSCEFAGRMIVVDLRRERVVRRIDLRPRRDAAGRQALARRPHLLRRRHGHQRRLADRRAHVRKIRFQPTGRGAHGLYPSRDSRVLYVSNRGEGSITLISFRTRRPVREVAPARRRLAGHGRRLGRRPRAVAAAAATTARSTRSRRAPGACCTASASGRARTACASGRSPGATRSATPASCASGTARPAGEPRTAPRLRCLGQPASRRPRSPSRGAAPAAGRAPRRGGHCPP